LVNGGHRVRAAVEPDVVLELRVVHQPGNLGQRDTPRFLLARVKQKEILAVSQESRLKFLLCFLGEHRLLVDRVVDNTLRRWRVLDRIAPNVSVAYSNTALRKRVRSAESASRV